MLSVAPMQWRLASARAGASTRGMAALRLHRGAAAPARALAVRADAADGAVGAARETGSTRAPHTHAPAAAGLYNPRQEHDACGVGFVADLRGRRTHTTVLQGLEAVEHLDHRGAAAADGLTGDGVGIMTQLPHGFFAKKLAARGVHDVDAGRDLAVGVFFLPQGGPASPEGAACRRIIEDAVAKGGMEALAWRQVPVGTYALGPGGLETLPDIQQLLLRRPKALAGKGPAGDDAFERLLYLTRRRIENGAKAAGVADLYVPSLSSRTIVYKGLVVAPNLRHLFPDLNDSDFQSSIALFHQRYSTNTFPMWGTVQPFRYLGHNGEINTLTGNVNWMRMREEGLRSGAFGHEVLGAGDPGRNGVGDLLPVCQGGSDSADLDNVFELLVQSGRSPLQAMSMLVPEAHEGHTTMDAELRAYYDYQRTLMEPWDGPAALCFTDGRVAAAAMDRNGLRPLRYWVTSAGKVVCGSEVGIVDVPTEKVLQRGRLGPGEMMAVNTETGELLRNTDIKRRLSTRRPYRAWIDRSVRHVRPAASAGLTQVLTYETMLRVLSDAQTVMLHGDEAVPAAKAAVDARQRLKKAFGYAKEDEELILAPMAATAHEPIGSMGDDTPIAAFSDKPQLVYRYLKQRFAEVTNPPIDPLLERERMSLNITFGRKGMLLEEAQHASFLLRFPSPVITEAQLRWLLDHKEFDSATIATTFPVAAAPAEAGAEAEAGLPLVGDMRAGIEAICAAAEAAVDGGASYLVLSDRGVDAGNAPVPAPLAVGAVHHHLIRQGKRMRASIIVESGEPREDHHVATLIGYGASLVNPYLAFETVAEMTGKSLAAAEAAKAAEAAAAAEGDDAAAAGKGKGKARRARGKKKAEAGGGAASASATATSVEAALYNYKTALEDGLLRIMSKMGIATVDSYRGAQVFEILGLAPEVVDTCFAGTAAMLPTVGWDALTADALAVHARAYGEELTYKRGTALPRSGAYMPIKDGEDHAFNPMVFNSLRASATKRGSLADTWPAHAKFADFVDRRPLLAVRDALDVVPAGEASPLARAPVPLEEVESVLDICKRFTTQAMSHGSISREAHEALSHASHLLGSRSNTGEGGEDSERFAPYARDVAPAPTDDKDATWYSAHWTPKVGSRGGSKIKQVASARFGVTPHYLVSAEQLEIKMAQGSKPGEGGHIPGHKVNTEIARNRHSPPGVTLISPPPHHDIYSIEDLAQLVYDLKRVNTTAPVSVKLVAQSGVGTIAAGVAKAKADIIQLSGNDGGTGASPLSSIKSAGLPWELGLAETQQVLVANGMRDKITLRVDGGLKTGRDVIIAALLGGDEFGFGTSALVALGCVMARKCHLNTCPVGIATQDPELRAKFKGTPEDVVTYLIHTAEQVRHELAAMGARSLDEVVGRSDLLRVKPDVADADDEALVRTPKGVMDLSALLHPAGGGDPGAPGAQRQSADRNQISNPSERPAALFGGGGASAMDLDEVVWRACEGFLGKVQAARSAGGWEGAGTGAGADVGALDLHFPITNASRSVGARLSGEIARRFGDAGLVGSLTDGPATDVGAAGTAGTGTGTVDFARRGTVKLHFHGVAGQSFGVWCNRGMELILRGEAHDFVGKGMYGGNIVLTPPADVIKARGTNPALAEATNVIMGNACLFGATGGHLYAAGRAGERFAVRNSGATAVVLGTGDHGCEYMTNGTVVVLGEVGRNFAAGMSGGQAFVFDPKDAFLDRFNSGMVHPTRLEAGSAAEAELKGHVQRFGAMTGSAFAAALLERWEEVRPLFWHVQPNSVASRKKSQALIHVPHWQRAAHSMDTTLKAGRYEPGDDWRIGQEQWESMQRQRAAAAGATSAAGVVGGATNSRLAALLTQTAAAAAAQAAAQRAAGGSAKAYDDEYGPGGDSEDADSDVRAFMGLAQ